MAFTTLAGLVSACSQLTVSGVKSKQAYRPRVVAATNLPMLYTRLPRRQREISSFTYAQGLKQGVIEIVILVEMMQLNTAAANDALAVSLVDALGDTLEANAASLGMDRYVIVAAEETIGDGETVVQTLVATVEVSG